MRVLRQLVFIVLAAAPMASSGLAAENTQVSNAGIKARGLTIEDFPRYKALATDVYAYEGYTKFGTYALNTVSGIIVTKGGVVLVDGVEDAAQGQQLVDNIKKITSQPVKYLIVGSDHGDHTGGDGVLKKAWPEMAVVSTPASQKNMVREKSSVQPTELVMGDKRTLKLGGTEIQLLNLGRAHTGGDLVVYLPKSKIMFMSEVFMRGVFPPIEVGYPSEWVETVRKAQAMDVDLYVPAHGWLADPATMKAALDDFRKTLEHVISEGKRLHAANVPCHLAERTNLLDGSPPDCEAAQQANWGPDGDLYISAVFEPVGVARVYQQIEGKLPANSP